MEVLVTGASGFVGQHLVRAMRNSGFKVRAAGRRPINIVGVNWSLLDDVNSTDWKNVCLGADIIVHLAGIAHTRHVSSSEFKKVNQEAPIALASALDPTQHLIFVSSIRAAVGVSSASEILENTEPLPSCSYGYTKLEAERGIQRILPNSCLMRPVSIYGSGARANIRHLEIFARSGLPLPVKSFLGTRSFLSVENLCSAIMFAAEKRLSGICNVSDPDTACLSDIVVWYREALGLRANIFSMPESARSILSLWPRMKPILSLASEPLVARPLRLLDKLWCPPHQSTREGVSLWAMRNTR